MPSPPQPHHLGVGLFTVGGCGSGVNYAEEGKERRSGGWAHQLWTQAPPLTSIDPQQATSSRPSLKWANNTPWVNYGEEQR